MGEVGNPGQNSNAMNWLKRKLIMILIYSKLKGGQLRHIAAHFDNLEALNKFTKELRQRFYTQKIIADLPIGANPHRPLLIWP